MFSILLEKQSITFTPYGYWHRQSLVRQVADAVSGHGDADICGLC